MQSLPNQQAERDDSHYASVHFAKNQTDPVYSNVRAAGLHVHEEVEYAAVKFNRAGTSRRWAALSIILTKTSKSQEFGRIDDRILTPSLLLLVCIVIG